MEKVMKVIDEVIEYFGIIAMVLQVIVVSYAVFGRYVLRNTPGWTQDTALAAMVWFGFLSISVGMRTDAHIQVTLIEKLIPNKYFHKALDWFNWLMSLCLAVFLVVEGINVTQLTSMNIIPGLGVPSSWMFAAVPVSGVAMLLQLISKARKLV